MRKAVDGRGAPRRRACTEAMTMKARVLFLSVLLASAGAVSATPDRAVHVVEQLVGFRG